MFLEKCVHIATFGNHFQIITEILLMDQRKAEDIVYVSNVGNKKSFKTKRRLSFEEKTFEFSYFTNNWLYSCTNRASSPDYGIS